MDGLRAARSVCLRDGGRRFQAAWKLGVSIGLALLVFPSVAVGGPGNPAPPNDIFADATSLGGSSSETPGTNVSATKQDLEGEPNHAGNVGGASVWYRWTAPFSAEVAIDTCGSSFDTLLGVYIGSPVGALEPVAPGGDDDCGLQSRVSFPATEGTTYQIAVDGYNTGSGDGPDQGTFSLRISLAPPPPEPPVAEPAPPFPPPGDPPSLPTDVPELDKDGLLALGKIRVRNDPLSLRVVPDCAKGRYKAKIGLALLKDDGSQVRGKKGQGFRCRKGRASFGSSGFIPLRRGWWRDAHSAEGIVLLAIIKRKGKKSISQSLWLHGKSQSGARTEKLGYTGTGTSCQSDIYSGGLITPVSSPTFDWGFVRPTEWTTVQAFGQTWSPRAGYTRWVASNRYTYQENTSGITLPGTNLAVVGGSLGVGGGLYFQWNGTNGYRVSPYSWGRIWIAIWTWRTGWRGNYILPENFWGARSAGDWCGFG